MNIAFIGVGSMARAIIPNLVRKGFRVSAWNRSRQVFATLDQVRMLDDVSHAFEQDIVITLLSHDAAVRETLIATKPWQAAQPGTVHILMSTLSPTLVDELEEIHREAGVGFVAAPVFGIPAVAAEGQLNILAAGAPDALERARPVFEVIGKKTWHLGDTPSQANIAKLAGNMMITQAIQSLAEGAALVQSHGLAPSAFFEIVTQTLFACPSYQRYGAKIAQAEFEPGFTLTLGLKDVNLALDAAREKGCHLPAAQEAKKTMEQAIAQGWGEKDWSAMAVGVGSRGR